MKKWTISSFGVESHLGPSGDRAASWRAEEPAVPLTGSGVCTAAGRKWRTAAMGGCALLVQLYASASAPAQEVSFQSAVNYAVGGRPSSVAVGDFNGDGKQDLAVANSGDSTVSVLLGNGDGTFQAAVNYTVSGHPSSVAVGDFNGDGKQDLAVANKGGDKEDDKGGDNVSVLLGNGDGTFRAAVNYAVGGRPSSVAVGDFNGDGKQDLAVANSGDSTVSVLLGNGDGTFRGAVNYTAGEKPVSVAVGDFNGDGKPDLVVALPNLRQSLNVLLGNGDGTFRAAQNVNYMASASSVSVVVGDFNGDGKPDLAVADTFGTVSVLLGNGDGTFQEAVNFGAGRIPSAVTVGDFNGDDMPDLAVGNSDGNNVSVLLNSTMDKHTIGGTVSGLTGSGLVLQNNGGNNLTVTGNGSFTFTMAVASGSRYNVTVFSQPTNPSETCEVTGGSGTVKSENITAVRVTCTINTYTIGGTVSGLTGSGLVLQNNGGNNLTVAANATNFTFTGAMQSGSGFNVTVFSQPTSPSETCGVTHGSGTVTSANITTVQVTCTNVKTAAPDFTFVANPSSVTISAPGASSSPVTLVITAKNGYNGTVAFSPASCSISPAGSLSSCSFSHASVGPGSGSTQATINTTASQMTMLIPSDRPRGLNWRLGSLSVALACMFLLTFPMRRRRWGTAFGVLAVALVATCTGCSNGGSPKTIPGTPTGILYTVTVTATANGGHPSHTASFTFTVQ